MALGWLSIAAYLLLRERSFPRAVAIGQSLAALAFFTHPNGLLLVLILLCTTLYLDRKRFRISTVAIAAAPYVAIAAAWTLYILQKPEDFITQFLGNVAGRGPIITTPLAALITEISSRYLDNYGMASWSSLAGRANALPLLTFLAATAACLLIPAIRRDPAYRLLLIWTAIAAFYLTELEGLKTPLYLLYITPLLSLLIAVAAT